MMRTNPHILEINTSSWLDCLSRREAKTVHFANIPDAELDYLQSMGFDAVWLMGVWKRSPKAAEIAKNNEEIIQAVANAYPQYQREKISASPYAVYDYTVEPSLGTEEGLKDLRRRLHDRGIALLLDFVGNHFAIDHPKILENPEFFINNGTEPPAHNPEWFFKADNGYYIAHGRDPYFPPWTDTAQLNYFNQGAREYMLGVLLRISEFCDGVRCDMAMLDLNKVHKDIWGEFIKESMPKDEILQLAVEKVQEKHPKFVFIAEVYWGLEWEIQELGFDYTYDKVLYDRLRFTSAESIRGHLGAEHLYQMRSIRFISNHDEEVSLKAFGKEKSLAAAAIIATISGARMFDAQQLYGFPYRVPIQYYGENGDGDKEIFSYYKKLLDIVDNPAFHGGQWTLREALPINDSVTHKNILYWTWVQGIEQKLVIINYADEKSVCKIDLSKNRFKEMKEEFSGEEVQNIEELFKTGLNLELNPFEVRIYTLKF